MSWPAWVLVICAVVALACMLYGALRAALAARAVKAHVGRAKALPMVADLAKAEAYVHRINDDLARVNGLLARGKAAIDSINESVTRMRIPEAVLAVRTAGAALRLLFSGR